MATKIIGTGSSVPQGIVTNDDLSAFVDTSDEWIRSRTGIRQRRLAVEESTTSMAAKAGAKALEGAQMSALDLDLILVATCSADGSMPNTACEVQELLGATHAVGMDINAACSGFVFALNTAHAYINSGFYKNALVIGAETLSRLIDWTDRRTCVLFGDGAGAVVIRADKEGNFQFIQKSDGSKKDALSCKDGRGGNPLKVKEGISEEIVSYLQMDGQEVFKFAVKKVPESILEVVEKVGVSLDEVKYFILHQANERILSSVAKRLGVSVEKFPMNLNLYGNTSAASIPILLDELNQQGKLEKGDRIILSGFGGGLTWGATLMEW